MFIIDGRGRGGVGLCGIILLTPELYNNINRYSRSQCLAALGAWCSRGHCHLTSWYSTSVCLGPLIGLYCPVSLDYHTGSLQALFAPY